MNVSSFLVCEFSDLSLNYNNGGDNKVRIEQKKSLKSCASEKDILILQRNSPEGGSIA